MAYIQDFFPQQFSFHFGQQQKTCQTKKRNTFVVVANKENMLCDVLIYSVMSLERTVLFKFDYSGTL